MKSTCTALQPEILTRSAAWSGRSTRLQVVSTFIFFFLSSRDVIKETGVHKSQQLLPQTLIFEEKKVTLKKKTKHQNINGKLSIK